MNKSRASEFYQSYQIAVGESYECKRQQSELEDQRVETNYPGHRSIFGHMRNNHNLTVSRYLSSIRLDAPKIIFDCQYEHVYQTISAIKSLFQQLKNMYGLNARSYEPFLIQLCNLHPDGRFRKAYSTAFEEDKILVESTSKSYLDLCPKKDLVYLSPNGRREMSAYDPTKTYIIGMLLDKGKANDEHTYNAARKDGIQCERLPLDRYVR